MGLSFQTAMFDFLLMWDRDNSATYTNIYCIYTQTLMYYYLERQENYSSFCCILLNWPFLAIHSFSLVPTANVSPFQMEWWYPAWALQSQKYTHTLHTQTGTTKRLYFNNKNCTCHTPMTDTKMFPVRCTLSYCTQEGGVCGKS